MTGQRSFSDTEMRLFNQVCGVVHATNEGQKNLIKSFVCDELASEWAHLVASMESNGPLSVLSEDELRYLTTLNSAGRGHQPGVAVGEMNIFSQIQPIHSQKTADHDLIKTSIQDIHQYNNILEKLVVKHKESVRRSVASTQRSHETDGGVSVVEQNIARLSSKRDSLKQEIHALEDKIANHKDRLGGTVQTKPNVVETDGSLHNQNSQSVIPTHIFATTLSSYDHIFSKLNALHGELDDAVDDDAILHTARRHASQIVLSLATKCRASLDTVFLEASLTYNKRTTHSSNYAQAINEERDAVYTEIQSLWDEMVPLAHMVVEKDFLKPISKKTEACSERQSTRDAIVSSYTSSMLHFMNERLRVLVTRVQMLVYHHQTLFNAVACMNSRAESKSAYRLGSAKVHPVQNKEKGNLKGHTLLETIKRQMELYGSISIEVDKPSQAAHVQTPYARVDKLGRYVTSRQKKGNDLGRNVQDFFERAAKAQLTDAEFGTQLLLDSVIADSAAGSQMGGHVYDDQQVEDSVATMRSQAQEIQTVFNRLQEGAKAPSSAPEFVTYAYNKTAKHLTHKEGEDSRLNDQEQCPKLSGLIRRWDDSASFTN
ncbi:hypothetical protein F4804DRAFT_64965 [Jackrogersella minutella]|nr:hypothetical protein F4804DRAFT_64965 [Jackrogersella minutella]